MQSDEEYQKEEKENEKFLESLMNHEEYEKKDDLEIFTLSLHIKNYHLPNWKKFPKSQMKRTHKKHITSNLHKKQFRKFLSSIMSKVLYPAEKIIKTYNEYFPDNPVTNIGFGKITEIKNNFKKIRKTYDGKLCTFYIKND